LKHIYWVDSRSSPVFPPDLEPDRDGLIAVGGDLSERVLIEAYSKGIFPWYNGPPVMWFSPDPRLLLYPADFHVPARLARLLRRQAFTVRFDYDFSRVIAYCAEVPRKGDTGSWIDPQFEAAYTRLHRLHLSHCVSVYQGNELCGGLYGVSLGRTFFGESMFSLKTNASKVALFYLVEWLKKEKFHFIDCQVRTEHLVQLGAVEILRTSFLDQLAQALEYPTHNYCWRHPEER
jgi:leucyl/phenylalanyl-tRNA--protein transferase